MQQSIFGYNFWLECPEVNVIELHFLCSFRGYPIWPYFYRICPYAHMGGQYQTSPLKKNPKGTFYNFIDVTLVQMIVKWDNVDWLMRGWSYVPYLCTILIGHSDIIDGWSLKK